jgi:hypothetical protein
MVEELKGMIIIVLRKKAKKNDNRLISCRQYGRLKNIDVL